MNFKKRIILFILILSCIKTSFSQMANAVVLKDGQNIVLDSFKLSQRDCNFSFYPVGIKKEYVLCLENIVVIYDSKGGTRDFRPCICNTQPINLTSETIQKQEVQPKLLNEKEEKRKSKEDDKRKKNEEKKRKKEEEAKKKAESKKSTSG
jgi:hypothetical protein